LLYGQVRDALSKTETGTGQAGDSIRNGGSLQSSLTSIRLVGSGEYRHYPAGQLDDSAWGGRAGPPDLGNCVAPPTSGSPSRVVAHVLSFRSAPRVAAGGGARTSGRGLGEEATVSATHPGHGRRANEAPLDHTTPPLQPTPTAPNLSRHRSRKGGARLSTGGLLPRPRGLRFGAPSASLAWERSKMRPKNGFIEAARIIPRIRELYHSLHTMTPSQLGSYFGWAYYNILDFLC
jgi:hypothetical protein